MILECSFPFTLWHSTDARKAWRSCLRVVLSNYGSYKNDQHATESSFYCQSDCAKSSAKAREMEQKLCPGSAEVMAGALCAQKVIILRL